MSRSTDDTSATGSGGSPGDGSFTEDDARWHALERRDRGADGRFIVAVKTTGIYCRPSCPSRQPKRANVRFFETAAAARAAGFRACKRCRPDRP